MFLTHNNQGAGIKRRARAWLMSIVSLAACSPLSAAYAFEALDVESGKNFRKDLASTHSSPIVLSPDEHLLWSVNPDLDTVSVIRTDRRELIARISVGREPRSISITPDGKTVYVANAADNSVTAIRVKNDQPDAFSAGIDSRFGRGGSLVTGSEPRSIVISPDGKRVFVANSSQDTLTVINARTGRVSGSFDLRNSDCNAGDRDRHFQPGALAVTADSRYLYVTRFLSFTREGGQQRDDFGKEGLICRLSIDDRNPNNVGLSAPAIITLATQQSGFIDAKGNPSFAFPNQLQNIVIRDDKAYLPNIGASPTGPQNFANNTQSFVSVVGEIGRYEQNLGALNLHLGGRDPEPGKQELYFANPWAIDFTTRAGPGFAYVVAAGSDILVKLTVFDDGTLGFTSDEDTTRYIDLNDPDNAGTNGWNAGKNPVGIVIGSSGSTAYVLNYLSRNVSVVDLRSDAVVKVIQTEDLPVSGSLEERLLVGAEMFFSSRGNFVLAAGAGGSNRNRLAEKGRQNCASCHSGGLTDGIIWQFATGPRKTLAVNGTFNPHDGSDQRIINASAIFDEVEDADFNTRLVSSAGLLEFPRPCIESPPLLGLTESRVDPDHGLVLAEWDNFEFAPCVMNPFTKPNGNRAQPRVQLPGSDVLVDAHDALVDWQRYAIRTPNRPMTRSELVNAGLNGEGAANDEVVLAGEQLFVETGCVSCHYGGKWSSSRKDFVSPPALEEIATEAGAPNANPSQYLHRFLRDIQSFALNVPGSGNYIPGYPAIGGIEKDSAGLDALGFDYNGDGKGSGYNVASILGTFSVPPYYHNGACETLMCVLADKPHRIAGLDAGQADLLESKRNRKRLARYLESIDELTTVH